QLDDTSFKGPGTTLQIPSVEWCQVNLDELFVEYLEATTILIEQATKHLQQLQQCIQFISSQLATNPGNVTLWHLQAAQLSMLEVVRQFVPAEHSPSTPRPQPINTNRQYPSQYLLGWLRHPAIQMISDRAELR